MRSLRFQLALTMLAALLFFAFTLPGDLTAQTPGHLVTPSQLQKATVDASQARQQSTDSLNRFFSTPEAQTALQSAHMNSREVKNAIAGLSDQELAQLAARSQKAQNDFAAGNISDHDLLIILILIAALILIIVAVH